LRDRPAPFSVRLSVITGPAVAGPDREPGGDIPARGDIPGVDPGWREGVSPTAGRSKSSDEE
jgi:hypothetical protein